jgi:hypothetical protein
MTACIQELSPFAQDVAVNKLHMPDSLLFAQSSTHHAQPPVHSQHMISEREYCNVLTEFEKRCRRRVQRETGADRHEADKDRTK